MKKTQRISISKFLSYVLRHHPEELDLKMDRHGWVPVDTLVKRARKKGKPLSRDLLVEIINQSEKKRFTLSADGRFIRAGYGHSIDVELGLEPTGPPDCLWHGTAVKNLESIRARGLIPGTRRYVHLSDNKDDARQVGSRHGSPKILIVKAGKMNRDGFTFYQSDSEPGIWLTGKVPPKFIAFNAPRLAE